MNELIASARDVMRRRCLEINGSLNVDLAKFVLNLQTSLNIHGIFGVKGTVNKLWDQIATVDHNQAVVAFIDGAIEFRMRNALTAPKWRDLVAIVQDCTALSDVSSQKIDTPGLLEGPVGIYERIISREERARILANHDWLVFLILLMLAEPIMEPGEIKAHTGPELKKE